MADWSRTRFALLTRHFLRQFLENDAISPEADRSQLLAVVGALGVSITLFISVWVSARYLMTFLMPGQAAVAAIDDRYFYLAFGMLVAALVAATQWDNLSIDSRDAAILEPLPVPSGTIRRAKLAAVAILGAGVAVAINLFPSVVFPWLLVYNFRQLGVWWILDLIAVHFVVAFAASGFGYLAVIALRETAALALGGRVFTRISPWLQGILIVILGSALLLLPASSSSVGQHGFDDWRAQSPPMWFLGAYEAMAGGVVADLPRTRMTPRQATADRVASALYNERRPRFPALARRAGWATLLTGLVAGLAYTWRARRLPSLSPSPPPAFRWRWSTGTRLARVLLVRDPAAEAGFHFALAAMWRNNTHRLTLACAAAAGFAMAILALSKSFPQEGSAVSARFLSVQPLLYGALLVGFRHIIRVPAELRANWGFQLAWRERGAAFVSGVKWAALLAVVVPALVVLLPLFVFALGPSDALMHAALGLAGAMALLELLLVDYDKVPFTCTYVPSENMKALGPLYAIAFVVGAAAFARLEQAALHRGSGRWLLLALALTVVAFRVYAARRTRPRLVEFDEAPIYCQTLNLSG